MRYTTYYEECDTITFDQYEQIRQTILKNEPKKHFETYTLRKLQFIGGADTEAIPNYYLCMKNQDEAQIYLEKKYTQNGIHYKKCLKISRPECEQILSGDLDWMKNHKQELLSDFYLQVTLNHLSPGYITEYKREMAVCKKEGIVTFFKKIDRRIGTTNQLLDSSDMTISCLDEGKVFVIYRKSVKLPMIISNMFQSQEESSEDFVGAAGSC